ncbi:phage tail fiber protein [Proteus terrae]|uniref:phage tail fiber protein n=1 Tax=Proteus terrae TaxID=1574161 RepID=UPI0035251355
MIYTTGTVSTVSGSAIVKGTGTKFKNNNPAINIGMTILIKSGNTNIPYMIKSVNSDTELVLAHPALATTTNTTFSIHITEPDNNSDAARTMVAINSYVEYFLDAMNTWMTQTGQTKIEMPNGEVVTLDSIKKMQNDIKTKADLNSSNVQRFKSGVLAEPSIGAAKGDMRLLIDLKADKFEFIYTNGSGWFGNQLPSKNGTFMLVGDYGVGQTTLNTTGRLSDLLSTPTGFWSYINPANMPSGVVTYGSCISTKYASDNFQNILLPNYGSDYIAIQRITNGEVSTVQLLSSNKFTVDSNGFYKRASPIIDINPDGTFITNDESEGATVTRVAQGEYLIEGVLGFNSDAGWGGVDGGIEIPLDVNKQPLIWVNSKINKDGSILVKTYHRTHPNAPEFARNDIDGYNDGIRLISQTNVLFPYVYRCQSNQSIT